MLATIGSMTMASRCAKTIWRAMAIPAKVVATPARINKGGCSYSITFDDRYEKDVRNIAEKFNLPIKKWYKEDTWHEAEDLS